MGSLLFAALSFERIDSLSTPADAWRDAVQKIDKTAPANALGRYRPFLNLGNELFLQGLQDEALRHYQLAESLGEPLGSALMNVGQAQQVLKQHPQAVESFNKAEAKGFTDGSLYFHRGESLFLMRQYEEAIKNFNVSLDKTPVADARLITMARRAESFIGLKDYPKAISDYETIIKQSSANGQRYSIGLAMAYVGNKDYAKAMDLINLSMTERPTARLYFARAMTYFYQGNKTASLADVQQALKAEPNNPSYKELESKLLGGNVPVVEVKKP
jgi:tetratricopeptide (TPR) repeat protein